MPDHLYNYICTNGQAGILIFVYIFKFHNFINEGKEACHENVSVYFSGKMTSYYIYVRMDIHIAYSVHIINYNIILTQIKLKRSLNQQNLCQLCSK